MARTTEDSACHIPAQVKDRLREFLTKGPPTEGLKKLTTLPLACECFPRIIQSSTREDQGMFVDKVDRVCHSGRLTIILNLADHIPFVYKGAPNPGSAKFHDLDRTRGSL